MKKIYSEKRPMNTPKLYLKVEKNTFKSNTVYSFFVEFIPSVAFRYVRGGFGKEVNLYLSWILWTFSVTLSWMGEE